MAVYRCEVCDFLYDDDKDGARWEDLPDDWVCPVCEASKSMFAEVEAKTPAATTGDSPQAAGSAAVDLSQYRRSSDDTETWMADIHRIAETGESINEPMRTRTPVVSWDDILVMGAQLAKIPLNDTDPVTTQTTIGPKADRPLIIETPVYVSHMSFGALSKECKIAMAKGTAMARTAMCSGEGGVISESCDAAYKYIFEYVPNRYSVTDECLSRVDAVEIKFGQSAKAGLGGHLPAAKVTADIAAVRGFPEGQDITSPACFEDIRTADDLKKKIDWLREKTGGRPIGVKLAAGSIEADLEVALKGGPDFVTIDGRPGGTGSAPKFIKAATSVPTIFALHRARAYLNERGADDISLVITGGLRISSDFAKALAMGADAVAVATAAMIACGCQQYRVCDAGQCPVGIATQDPELRARFDIEQSSQQLANYLNVCTSELKTFARLTGNNDVHGLTVDDLCATNSEISDHTSIRHA